jgi:uncharacterized protein (UPF0276 family)
LDLNNIHTNGVNFSIDPYDWIDQIDLAAVRGIHIAGGYYDDEGTLVDSHSNYAPQRVWDLFRYVCQRIRPAEIIVEWTDDTPPYEEVLKEIHRAEQILQETSPWMDLQSQRGSSAVVQGGGLR